MVSVAGLAEKRRTLRPEIRVRRAARLTKRKAQGLHAGDAVAIGSFARARFRPSQGGMQLKAAHQVMRQHAELRTLGVMDVAGTILEPEDLSGVGQMGE